MAAKNKVVRLGLAPWSEMSHLAELFVSGVHIVPHCCLLNGDKPVPLQQLGQVPPTHGGRNHFPLALGRALSLRAPWRKSSQGHSQHTTLR